MEDELRALGDVIVCTDDGSYGRAGFVTDALADLLAAGGIDQAYAVGPVPMMRAVVGCPEPFASRHGLAQCGHGRWHGHVRRLPGDRCR